MSESTHWRLHLAILATCLASGCGGGGGSSDPQGPQTKLVLFNSSNTGNFEIYSVNPDGTGVSQLTNDTAYNSWWPRVSPDRRQVLFYRNPFPQPSGPHEDYSTLSLWMMNADDPVPIQIRPVGRDGWTFQGHAEWSPDSSRLVMIGGTLPNLQIYVTDAAGGNAQRITDGTGLWIDPSWSPDGNRIVCVGNPAASTDWADNDIYVMPASGGVMTRLTNDALADNDPRFSPDGRLIAWESRTNTSDFDGAGSWSLMLMNADGGNQHALLQDRPVINSMPAWSPSGKQIYFHRLDSTQLRFRLFRINQDGSDLLEINALPSASNEYPCPIDGPLRFMPSPRGNN